MTARKPGTSRANVVIDVSSDGVRSSLSRARVTEIVAMVLRREKVGAAMISVAWVSRTEIARLNRKHVGHRGATDIVTFAMNDGANRGIVIGDIYIAPEVARDNAKRLGAPIREEMTRLVVHGTLHALGHAHPEGDDRSASPMWRRQESLVRAALARHTRAAS